MRAMWLQSGKKAISALLIGCLMVTSAHLYADNEKSDNKSEPIIKTSADFLTRKADDLEAFLAFKPWSTDDKRSAYLEAVSNRQIPPLWSRNPSAMKQDDETWKESFMKVLLGEEELW